RAHRGHRDVAQKLFQEVDLGSQEGLALMSLAEALLRVPDVGTAETLIQEKLGQGDWQHFRRHARSTELKAMGVLMDLAAGVTDKDTAVGKAASGLSLPAIRAAATQMIQFLAKRFVFAPTIEDALTEAQRSGDRYSFDMLGEGARTYRQGDAFREAYTLAIERLGGAIARGVIGRDQSISVKLSALHPRFEAHQQDRLRDEIIPVVEGLAVKAMALGVGLTIDAEEADRLEAMLDVFEALARSPRLSGWNGLGLAVQAYGKRATSVIAWLDALGRDTKRLIPVRLVKGAYWDGEIKHAQTQGLPDYPVFTRKAATDVSYLACARKMLASQWIKPQFATHNVITVCAIRHIAGQREFEFQRLHGMGDALYEVLETKGMTTPVRVYAPIGQFKELLPYLIRRMLENSANTSFVRLAFDPRHSVDAVAQDPIAALETSPVRKIPLPSQIFPGRTNSAGLDLSNLDVLDRLGAQAKAFETAQSLALERSHAVRSPADRRRIIGQVRYAEPGDIDAAIARSEDALDAWRDTAVGQRARILDAAADLLEQRMDTLVGLIVAEAGRTIRDAVSEVREAIDFCRYYANEARRLLDDTALPSVTGERNVLRLSGRGVFACISPWNFPLAIFIGQVAAALVAGNTVLAKPAEQTPLIASLAVALLHKAGVPAGVLQLVQGDAEAGKRLVADARISGVAFTGSTDVAFAINRSLAARNAPIGTLIAETGGINAMVVDASALPEQVVDDVIASGFLSAGQRCSSLRHLFIQDDCADRLIEMIAGAMDTLRIGDPSDPATDIGPVIDEAARDSVTGHVKGLLASGARLIKQVPMGPDCAHGSFVAPTLLELPQPSELQREVFGPVVHVNRWNKATLGSTLSHIRSSGYGLTLGVHSRITGFAERVIAGARCGNSYINRNMIGAVVGAQPFGGRGFSGTGPKAGGPHYLLRFASEEVVTTNLTAIGGDTALLAAVS
ncbi:MAG TPA: bifunctional proline dehydrogenase/L-glutamate gamma-semialdehyde dehydrogenase PutA, partial [Rhizomicrobium sp.]|nr:bifunctional proline dehydrogenase/L-glutamate gamma-semialdehyde dehydrogenase PutA [Rhizomicrobium sp.]